MSTKRKTLGVLGGMGPQASIRFYDLIVRLCEEKHGARNTNDYPHILLSNLPIPDLIENESNEKQAVDMLAEEARKLATAGAEFLVITCNTMHRYLRQCEEASGLSVLSMVQTVVNEIVRNGHRKVGVLGTPSTLRWGLYTLPLQEAGIETVLPTSPDIVRIGTIIRSIVANEYALQEQRTLLHIVQKQIECGAEGIILGCTELPLVLHSEHVAVPLFDSLRLLAEAACAAIFLGCPKELQNIEASGASFPLI